MTTYRHRITGPAAGGDVWTTSMHSDGPATLLQAHNAFTAFVNAFVGVTLKAMWPNEQRTGEVITDSITTDEGKNTAQLRAALSIVGTGTGPTISQRTALVVGLRTLTPTRAGRGRMYFPPVDATHLDPNGQLMTTDRDALVASFGAALSTFQDVIPPVIYHRPIWQRQTSPPVLLLAGSVTPVTSVTIGQILGTQRRRTNRASNSYGSAVVA